MSRPRILQPGISYTFSKYFELPYAPGDILAEFNFRYERKRLDLPRYTSHLNCLEFLSRYLPRNLTYVNPITQSKLIQDASLFLNSASSCSVVLTTTRPGFALMMLK
jgi:hypothetical protein